VSGTFFWLVPGPATRTPGRFFVVAVLAKDPKAGAGPVEILDAAENDAVRGSPKKSVNHDRVQ
jgi:hypothetical protein